MEIGIEDLTRLPIDVDFQFLKDLQQTVHGHFYAFLIGGICCFLLQRPAEVVIYREKFLHGAAFSVPEKIVLFLLGTLTVVVIFCGQPQIIVMLCLEGFLRLGKGIRSGLLNGNFRSLLRLGGIRCCGSLRLVGRNGFLLLLCFFCHM